LRCASRAKTRMKVSKRFSRSANLSLRAGEPGSAGNHLLESMKSQLELENWSVISERGREASSVTYEEARRLVHRLAGEGRHGLCIISDSAASRMPEIPESREVSETATKT